MLLPLLVFFTLPVPGQTKNSPKVHASLLEQLRNRRHKLKKAAQPWTL